VATEDDFTTSPLAVPGSAAALLRRYIARLNQGVRGGDFTAMLAELTDDAQLVFEGIPVGPFRGREAIGTAYRLQPPDDELELLRVDEDGHGGASGSYAWSERPGVVAGEVQVTARGGRIARVLVRYGDDGRSRQARQEG
jgi:steroid Delta-isomerase